MERLKQVQQSTRKLSSSMEISKTLLSTRTNALVILVTLTVNLMLVSSLSAGEQESSGLQSAVRVNEGQLESRASSPRIHNSQRSVNKNITSIEVSVNSRESANVSTSQIVGSTTTLVPPILSSTAASGSSAPLSSFGQKPDKSVTDPMVTAASSAVGSLSTPPTSIVSPSDSVSRRTTSAQEGQRSSGKPSKVSKKQIRQNPQKQDQRQQQPQVSSKEVRNSTSPVDKIELDLMSSARSVRFLDNHQLPTAANEKQQRRNGQQIPDEQTSPVESSNQQQKSTKRSAKWTHFGARLKPLTSSSSQKNGIDYHASNSKAKPSIVAYEGGSGKPSQEQTAGKAAHHNRLDHDSDSDDDDEQDSEAMLYNMLQQQDFLMRPDWLESLNKPAKTLTGAQNSANGGVMLADANNRRVIKLLKSYSHIHQVDDRDDQPRGSSAAYNRLSPSSRRRPTTNSNGNIRQRQHQNQQQIYRPNDARSPRPRYSTNEQATGQRDQHIYVSSKPVGQVNQANRLDRPNGEPNSLDSNDDSGPQSDSEGRQQDEGSNGSDAASSAQPGASDEDDFECPDDGIFADETSGCQSYMVCQSGAQVQQKFQCPMGTLFNNIILTCDFAHNVQCGKKPHRAVNGEQSLASQPGAEPSYAQRGLQSEQTSPGPPLPRYQQLPQPWQQQPEQQNPQHQPQGSGINIRPSSAAHMHTNAARAHDYYPQSAGSQNSASESDDSDSDSGKDSSNDDEPTEPLVPATLPPRPTNSYRSVSMPPVLPYKAPPSPMIPSHAPIQNYPPRPTPLYQQEQQPSPYSSFGMVRGRPRGDITPSYFDRSNGVTPAYAEQTSASTKASVGDENQSSYNMVINHVTTDAHKLQRHPAPSQRPIVIAEPEQLKPAPRPKPYQGAVNLAGAQHRRTPAQLPKTQSQLNRAQPNALRQEYQQQQASRANQARQSWSSPTTSYQVATNGRIQSDVHSGSKNELSSFKPTLVDLTNGKQIGVSSDAINNGLLLIVRHGNTPASSTLSPQHAAPDSARNPGGDSQQAYVVDPIMIRNDSPVDAQLFPNVHRVLSASQNQNQIAHKAHQQPVQAQSARQEQTGKVHPALPPMEPPRPQNLIETTSHLQQSRDLGSHSQDADTGVTLYSDSSSNKPKTVSPPLKVPESQQVLVETGKAHGSTEKREKNASKSETSSSNLATRSQSKRLKAAKAPEKQQTS